MSSDEQSINDSQLSDFLAKHSLPPDFLSRHTKALRYEMEISLREAMFGGLRQISINRMEICTVCQGQGNLKQRLWSRSHSTCPTCGGSGTVGETKQIQVTIPPKMFGMMFSLALFETAINEDSSQEVESNRLASVCFMVTGEGHSERDGSRGDLNVHLSLAEDPNFSRADADLVSYFEISQAQADLGYIIVDTLDGLVRLKLPPAITIDDAEKAGWQSIEEGVRGLFAVVEDGVGAIFLELEGRGLYNGVSSSSRGKHLLIGGITETPKPLHRFVDEDALDSTVGINYRPLRDWLRSNNWREADAETHKLMLQISGREQDGWLDEASLNRFPCQDLQTIDRLWSKYSDGQFGFTAQKSVWETCYRPTTYKEGWNNFKEQVGWRKKGAIDGYEHDIQKIEGGISMRTILWDVMVPDEERTLSNLGELPSWTFLIQPYEQRDILEQYLPQLPLVVGSSRHPEYWLMSRILSCKL